MATLNQGNIIKGLENLTAKLNRDSFFFDFLKVFGFSRSTIQKLAKRDPNRNIAVQDNDYGLTKQVYFRSIKRNQSVRRELEELLKEPVIKSQKIRFIIVTNFKTLMAFDSRVEDSIEIDIKDLKSNFDFFLPLTGKYEKPLAYSSHPADTKACEKMGRLYDIIRQSNHYDDSNIHTLNVFLTRLLFCFFAEDTGIFPIEGQMTKAIESVTQKDGKELQQFFTDLFTVLDLPQKSKFRKDYPAILQAFPYVNGGLFKEKCTIPKMNAKARNILLDCGRLTWAEISPVIFGSMFQSVMDPKLRHELGAHYTSEKNIFKVINPLFLDDLKVELKNILVLEKSKAKLKKLQDFQNKLASIVCLDPAAGCGNFLIVAYRELKQLELQTVEAMLSFEKKKDQSLFMLDWSEKYSKVSIDHFYGIEIEEFPADIARVSMWLMEHVMNLKFGEKLGTVIPSIPLKSTAHIVCANALTTDWAEIVDPKKLNYIIGNPPFSGSKYSTEAQKQDMDFVFQKITKKYRKLDYVCAWFVICSKMIEQNPQITCALVSTNSITQGEQVSLLWPLLFKKNIVIHFAYTTFKWANEAKGSAGVHCVITGFGLDNSHVKKRIFNENKIVSVKNISPYFIEGANNLFVSSCSKAICDIPPMIASNKPCDYNKLKLELDEFEEIVKQYPACKKWIKRMVGARELLHAEPRYCLWLVGCSNEEINNIPPIKKRVELCRQARIKANTTESLDLAKTPALFREQLNPDNYLIIPCVSSERRQYIPMTFLTENTIPVMGTLIIPDADFFTFGILTSRMHMTWMRTVCGRLKSDYRYSRDLCYNTFPWPQVNQKQKEQIKNLATNVLIAREMHPEMTLAELYDPDKMPDDLKKAHQELDFAVDHLYRKKGFESDEDRLQHLFKCYEALVNGKDIALIEE